MSDETWDTAERELQLLAVLDRFARDVEAGAAPRLSTYLERFPQFAAELTDFASDYLLIPVSAAPDTSSDVAAAHSEAATRDTLSAGSRRALGQLFPDVGGGYGEPSGEGTLKAVAERRADYVTGGDTSADDPRDNTRHATGEPDENR